MTILTALAQAYDRLPDAPVPGYATQKVSILVSLKPDGELAGAHDIRIPNKKKKKEPVSMTVPAPMKRTVAVMPNALWDKTSYALGVSANPSDRTIREHAAFLQRQRELLAGTDDPGLLAFLRFLGSWHRERWAELGLEPDLLDQNVAFGLEDDRYNHVYLHDRPAARALFARPDGDGGEAAPICLVTGRHGTTARLHPSIKGVWGGQVAGGAIVSYNLDAFESYGHAQGDNAPVSEEAAAAYTGALNRFLARDSGHRVQIGDASTVFWASAKDAEVGKLAAMTFGGLFSGPPKIDESAETKEVANILIRLQKRQPLRSVAPQLTEGVRFFVLGLAPNAARISIRFWLEDDFGHLMENYQRFWEEMAIEPPPPGAPPVLWQYLTETAVLGKTDNVPPNLAGEWMRSILAGTPYPATLLATVLMRIRADGEVNGRRVSILKALLRRNFHMSKEEAPVALDPNYANRGYLLGRLFAAYEQAQSAALGRNVNATIKDKYYGAASAQPRKVFSFLESGSANHLSKLGKIRAGQRVNIEKTIAEIMDLMVPSLEPGKEPFPASLPPAEQALFGLGYYHQRSAFFAKSAAAKAASSDTSDSETNA